MPHIEIVPIILVSDFREIQEKAKLVERYADWVQIDVMDGRFVDPVIWNNPAELASLHTSLKLELHLMIDKPEDHIDQWINSGAHRIIVHYEATQKIDEIIQKVKRAGLEIGVALKPETDIKVIDPFVDQLDLVLVMTVHPGASGQAFLTEMLKKISDLRHRYADLNISVDGGINLETAPQVIAAGANILGCNSAIFKSGDIQGTIKKLKNLRRSNEN